MLTMMKLSGNPHDVTRYHTAQENYYFKQASDMDLILDKGIDVFDNRELDYVKVGGVLAKDFGLTDGQHISQQQFQMILEGKFLDGTKCTKTHKNNGYDLTFSAPKTISIAGVVTDKDPEIVKCHEKAVKETMKEIERYYSMAHPKADMEVKSEGMLWVQVNDGFSREHDPHLHTHVVISNITKYEGKFMALRTREIMHRDFNKMWGTYYRKECARLITELGHTISYVKGGEWRLDKVSQACEKEFSTRHMQIVKGKEKGMSEMEAWRKTRKNKDSKVDKKDLVMKWQKRAELTNTTALEENKAQAIKDRQAWIKQAEYVIEAKQARDGKSNTTETERWLLAVERATQKSATASEEGIIEKYLAVEMEAGNWGTKPNFTDLKASLAKQVEAGAIYKMEERYTSYDFMITERKYFNWTGKKHEEFTLKPRAIEKDLKAVGKERRKENKKQLSETQEKAVINILKNDDFLTVVQGDAGSGKTTMLKMVKEIYEKEGIKVKGLAMQGVAADNLHKETDIESTTVTTYLNSTNSEKGQVIVIDEASMIDSRSAQALFEKANKEGSKVILVGDKNQLESIQAGGPFNRLVIDAENKGKLINLNENFRQRDKDLLEAVTHARNGEMGQSLDILDRKGKIQEIEDVKIRRFQIAKTYDESTLIISGTATGKKELNELVREKLVKEGKLDKDGQVYIMARKTDQGEEQEYELRLSKGDQITFTKNEYLKYDVKNGEKGRVIGLKDRKIVVELEGKDKRKIEIDLKEYNNIDYGYALTTYKSQGLTYNKVVVETDTRVKGLSDMRAQYVNITRARDDVRIFTNDKEELKELALKKSMKRDTLDENIDLKKLEITRDKVYLSIREQKIQKEREDHYSEQSRIIKEMSENIQNYKQTKAIEKERVLKNEKSEMDKYLEEVHAIKEGGREKSPDKVHEHVHVLVDEEAEKRDRKTPLTFEEQMKELKEYKEKMREKYHTKEKDNQHEMEM